MKKILHISNLDKMFLKMNKTEFYTKEGKELKRKAVDYWSMAVEADDKNLEVKRETT